MERTKLKFLKCIQSYLLLFSACLILQGFSFSSAQNVTLTQSTVRVGVVLDLGSMAGRRSKTSISMALEDFYVKKGNFSTRIELEFRDSMSDVISAASAVVDLMKNFHVEVIMGPQTSTETEFVAFMCNRSQVPLLSFSATSPSISPSHLPFFIRANINDSSQSVPITAFIQNFGWREVVPIYEDSDYGAAIIPSLVDALQSVGIMIPNRLVISTEATDDHIDRELVQLITQQTRVFVVHMLPALASQFFRRAQIVGMMSQEYVWIVTDSVGSVLETLDPDVTDAMEGVIVFRPYFPSSPDVISFNERFKSRFQQDNPGMEIKDATIYQLWAYDAVWAMAKALEKTKITNSSFIIPSSNSTSTDLSTLGVSETGPMLLSAILDTTFEGLAGNFKLVDGQLQLLAFEIVNVVGKGSPRTVGFWTSDKGIIREIGSNKDNNSSNSLKSIIWPGDLIAAPKGWVVPTSGKVLRILVPLKTGFNVFVNVSSNVTDDMSDVEVTGYCIDVFNEALRKLPYALPHKFYPLNLGSYNELVNQVYLKNYDALVGDVTIRANRTNYVDFTMPFTESGVSMVVPVSSDRSHSMWIFLKPLDPKLWGTSLAAFVWTGFVVWVIEHRINPKFRGEKKKQFGTVYYYTFSTLVFAHKERLKSILSMTVVIIWVFVVLILTSSYTASLTSMLTVQQLKPSITDVNQLIKQDAFVGYQNGSFVKDLLVTKLGFDANNLKSFSTADDYADALAKGSANGGVAAIFDETPYIKVFLSQYCDNNYVMAGPVYKTDGFSFVFPRGSPLIQDMSRAVLSVTEGDEMTHIEKKWLGDSSACIKSSTSVGSSRLRLVNFGGLFIITGVASFAMLLISIVIFVYDEREVLSMEKRRIVPELIQRFHRYCRNSTEENIQGNARQSGNSNTSSGQSAQASSSQLRLPQTNNSITNRGAWASSRSQSL